MMAPIVLDLSRVPVVLIGRGALAERRLAQLDGDGPAEIRIYSDAPSVALVRVAGNRLIRRLPEAADLAGIPVVFIADFDAVHSANLARLARDRGALVNVEDRTALCDFHVPATVRRGDLVLTVSTGGKSPALARRLRLVLAELFPQPWAERLESLASLRLSLKQRGAAPRDIMRATEDVLDRESWLPGPQPQH